MKTASAADDDKDEKHLFRKLSVSYDIVQPCEAMNERTVVIAAANDDVFSNWLPQLGVVSHQELDNE